MNNFTNKLIHFFHFCDNNCIANAGYLFFDFLVREQNINKHLICIKTFTKFCL